MPFTKGQPGGPGRPRRRDKHAGAVAKAEKQIGDRLPWLIGKLFELADGVTVQVIDDDGVNIYTRPPDRGALEYLVNRIMGKPIERKQYSGPDDGPIPIEVFDYQNAIAPLLVRDTDPLEDG
jgi:hypothetical protein